MRKQREASDATAGALEALRQAYDHAVETVEADTDPSRALAGAIQLRAFMEDYSMESCVLRDRQAKRVWKAEELSLRCLAVRVGVSKSRAHQIIRTQEVRGGKDHGDSPGT